MKLKIFYVEIHYLCNVKQYKYIKFNFKSLYKNGLFPVKLYIGYKLFDFDLYAKWNGFMFKVWKLNDLKKDLESIKRKIKKELSKV